MTSKHHVILGDLAIEKGILLRKLADIEERIAQAHAMFVLEASDEGIIELPDNVLQLPTALNLHPSQQ
tara:strand:+ start:267 stop:470 length:204 start_codon:yes stop_codon:yes gene_type:complete